ncbi:virulence plasmid 65kDa B protein-domain-containing protein, partial [Ilyonectria robusta]|uniref:virulence plasmid 65kDa B protein-domain-containing protein n=1 Tax=Ilyonectria robusta TaxID=1079257 RepID=UPI001E8E0F8C
MDTPENKPKQLLESKIPQRPTLSLPKGGGAIQGMGEKIEVNPSNGTASLSIPIKVPAGRSGMQPNLALTYDSGVGNSEFGLGWRLSGVESITRKTSKGIPQYNDHGTDDEPDVFLLAGAEDLVPVWKRGESGSVITDASGRPVPDEVMTDGFMVRVYAPRIITDFSWIERWTRLSDPDDMHWRVVSPENITTIFGASDTSRIYDTAAVAASGRRRIFSWLQDEVYDSRGNAMTFSYKRDNSEGIDLAQAHELNRSDHSRSANAYLKTIRYGNVAPNRDASTWEAFPASSLTRDQATWKFSVVLDYGDESASEQALSGTAGSWVCRQDPFSRHNAGFEVRTYRLCRRVLVFHHFDELGVPDCLVSSVDLAYDENPVATYLISAQLTGYLGTASVHRKSLPPVEFEYSRFPSAEDLESLPVNHVDAGTTENLPIGLDNGGAYRWIDLDGEGISGVLAVNNDAWYYKRNMTGASDYGSATPPGTSSETDDVEDDKLAAQLGPLEPVYAGPFLASSARNTQFGDINGNGKLDLVSRVGGQWGYYERAEDETLGWTEFRPFLSGPSITADQTVQLIDLTGDGLADILIHQDQLFIWFPFLSQDAKGYGPPQSVIQDRDPAGGPVCVFGDSEQRIFLADMSGDGLVDLCRVRNGDCCYWPQLGYGRFGPQVSFDNAPWADSYNQFSSSRVILTDLDGSGTADLVYLGENGVDLYRNQSGNSFSPKLHVPIPFAVNGSALDIVDLLGNGTQCLVSSSRLPGDSSQPLVYVDIFRNKKPHLLTGVKNNVGAETRLHYAQSTKFYIQDRQNGRRWLTPLPFPVHCVERRETIDRVSGNFFCDSYRYSHGFYDGVEREFRGFARVERTDTSDFSKLKGVSPTNSNPAWKVPPARTVTWFHTGAYFHRESMSELLSREYADMTPYANLDDTPLPPDCTQGVQMMEACRALKGRQLRSEVYADDGSDKTHIPYSVSQTNYVIDPRQVTQDGHGHGIYFVRSAETVDCHLERVMQDPRVTHQMTLEVNRFGSPTKELHISYGRQPGQSPLSAADAAVQERTVMLYKETDFTNSLDGSGYRAPAACESRQYEMRGLKPKSNGGNGLFSYADMVADAFSAILLVPLIQSGDEISQARLPARQLVNQERTLFQADNLSSLLPVGEMQSMCLPGAYHQLVYTPGLVQKLFAQDSGSETLISMNEIFQGKGYVDLNGDGKVWTASARVSYATDPSSSNPAQELEEARNSFFQAKTLFDGFGNPFYVEYDRYKLFPLRTRDALDNTTVATMDYRTLQPARVSGPNGNVSSVAFDALGIMSAIAVSGKPSDNLGDTVDGYDPDITQGALDSFIANPTESAAASLLGNATTRILHDPWKQRNAGTPVFTCLISRETHVNHAPPQQGRRLFQVHISYTDGFERVIQTKSRTKPGPLSDDGGPIANDRWVGSGWTVFNNKGDAVQRFEPFFDTTAAFQPEMAVGVSSKTLYDPLGRAVATLHPNRTFEKTVFGPWHQQVFDVNDNVLVSDPRADPDVGHLFGGLPEEDMVPSWYDGRKNGALGSAERDVAMKTAQHANTPKSSHLDSLGRVFLVEDSTSSERVGFTAELDVLGNLRAVRDALGRKAFVAQYDLCQRRTHYATIDAGSVWNFVDGTGAACMSWNARGFRTRLEYDKLRRRTKSWWRDAGTNVEVLTSHISYGEEYVSSGPGDTAKAHNLRGEIWRVLDQSGMMLNKAYDWSRNLTESSRKLARIYTRTFDVATEMDLEEETHNETASFDVLSRPVRTFSPDGTITSRVYNESGLLDIMSVNAKGEQDPQSDPSTWEQEVTAVEYNPKGQITRLAYGNGTVTTRTYDRRTFELKRLRTTAQDERVVQDLNYIYDPVGNISSISDSAQQTIFFRNTVVSANNDYTYDGLYRLVSASGREHLGQHAGPPSAVDPDPVSMADQANNGQAMGLYTETYKYDLVGNLLSVRHASSDSRMPGWTRTYAYNEASAASAASALGEPGSRTNRLSQTAVGSVTETYGYEGSAGLTGNMTRMSSLPVMVWDFEDRLQATSRQVVSQGQVPEMTYYVYTWQGDRVRKIVESQAGPNSRATPQRLHERIYVGDLEIFRKYNGSGNGGEGEKNNSPAVILERTTFHARAADYGLIANICSRTQGTDTGVPRQTRVQLRNHLGSATAELDGGTGTVLSYEEYYPFGSSSYAATS